MNYESPIGRARALYELPTAPQRGRLLELCCAREALFDKNWRGEDAQVHHLVPSRCVGSPQIALPFAPESFDLVVLHKTLDDLAVSAGKLGSRFEPAAFLADVARLLTPGGVIAGCIGNRSSPKLLARRLRGTLAEHDSPAFLTVSKCRRLLQSTGWSDVRVFSLLPNWQTPLRLIEADSPVARIAFRRELESRRWQLSAWSYWSRRLIVDLALYPYLEESIFFCGCRATC